MIPPFPDRLVDSINRMHKALRKFNAIYDIKAQPFFKPEACCLIKADSIVNGKDVYNYKLWSKP